MRVRRLCGDEEVADLIKVVQPYEDDFEDLPPEEEEPRPLDFDDEDKFERGYN